MKPLFNAEIDAVLSLAGPVYYGHVVAIEGEAISVAGLHGRARLGESLVIQSANGDDIRADIVGFRDEQAIAHAYDSVKGVASGARAILTNGANSINPSQAWIGEVLDAFGANADGVTPEIGPTEIQLEAPPPPPSRRKRLGPRIKTGICVFDTFLPICEGQRIGLFAGAGVGKSTLLANLATMIDTDVTVIALIGERGREVRGFVEDVLGPEGMTRSVVIASTSDQPAMTKKRGAHLAMAVAEYFRSTGKRVLLLFDSLTRYADAHREVALAAGETPSLQAYPPSTFRTVSALVERAGPGQEAGHGADCSPGHGDITAIFTVLAAGADMDEPVSDMVRGALDGHVVLDREIAERGRFPAIDVRRSVSRALPAAASDAEMDLLTRGREILGVYEEAEMIIRAGLYKHGSDARVDAALKVWPALDAFIAETDAGGPQKSFERLEEILKLSESN